MDLHSDGHREIHDGLKAPQRCLQFLSNSWEEEGLSNNELNLTLLHLSRMEEDEGLSCHFCANPRYTIYKTHMRQVQLFITS
jgi:hypothetical protein